jgi:hypothetical protein
MPTQLTQGETKMKTTKIITATAIASVMTLSMSTSSLAHSDHDHSKLPLNWTFVNDTSNKIEERIDTTDAVRYVGLSKFEQKKLKHYGIQYGNSFHSVVDNRPIQVTKTMGGVQIDEADPAEVANNWRIPLRQKSGVSLVSMGNHHAHVGHDHSYLPYEWEFAHKTMNRIQNRMDREDMAHYVGLNRFEQKLLNKYGIKAGNTFHSYINGADVLLERTASGVKVVKVMDDATVAKSNENMMGNES